MYYYSPSIEVRGWHIEQELYCPKENVRSEKGIYIDEGMLRARSHCLASRIDRASDRGDEKIVVELSGSDQAVEMWADWISGQPMYSWTDDDLHGDVLHDTVDVYALARECKDYDCCNACLDTIRLLSCHSNDLHNPIRVLEPVLKHVDTPDDKPSEMIMDLLVNGPCAELGRTQKWLETLRGSFRYDRSYLKRWPRFFEMYRRECKEKSAQASKNADDVPNSMAADDYHLSEPEGHDDRHSISGESQSSSEFDSEFII